MIEIDMRLTFVEVDLRGSRIDRLTRAVSCHLLIDVWGSPVPEKLVYILQQYEAEQFSQRVKLDRLNAVWKEKRLG